MAKRLTLSHDKKVAGVCGGIAQWLGVDPTLIRLLWLAAILLYGSGLFLYILCWIVLPQPSYHA